MAPFIAVSSWAGHVPMEAIAPESSFWGTDSQILLGYYCYVVYEQREGSSNSSCNGIPDLGEHEALNLNIVGSCPTLGTILHKEAAFSFLAAQTQIITQKLHYLQH